MRQNQGNSTSRPFFPGTGIANIKIKPSWDHLILIMRIPIMVQQHLYTETLTGKPLFPGIGIPQNDDKIVMRLSYLYNEYRYTGKTTFLYWDSALSIWLHTNRLFSFLMLTRNHQSSTLLPSVQKSCPPRSFSTQRGSHVDRVLSSSRQVYSALYVTGLILGLRSANERRRYKVTLSLIGWAQS